MNTTGLSVIALVASVGMLTGCKEDNATTVVPVRSETVKNLPADPTTGVNPTTGQPLGTTGKFTLFRFANNATVANTDSATTKWDAQC